MRTKVIIMGAAGKDFHVFNTCYRENPFYEVIAFTATQIPNIEGRVYPKELAGKYYKKGIPIYPETELTSLIKKYKVNKVVFAYSDVSYEYIREKEILARKAGADFVLPDTYSVMLPVKKPVIAVCAVRTGCGKSPTSRKILDHLKKIGKKVAVVRHPMPYGDLRKQVIEKFTKVEDFKRYKCTIEEIEEYEHHVLRGNIVFAGTDYQKIKEAVEREADIVVWDGGNNDIPFFKPDLHITIVDPHRVGHELTYYPGKINFLIADVLVMNKLDSAGKNDVRKLEKNIEEYNPKAILVKANSLVKAEDAHLVKGKRVLVVEDGPTHTHGGMKFGAGTIIAKKFKAEEIIDPRPYLVGSLIETFKKYPHIGKLLPAMGYDEKQVKDLEKTINKCPVDTVIIGTPINLARIINIKKPYVYARYETKEISHPDFAEIIDSFLEKHK